MKKMTVRSRKILSRVFRVISVAAAALILQACYGMPPPRQPAMPVQQDEYIIKEDVGGK